MSESDINNDTNKSASKAVSKIDSLLPPAQVHLFSDDQDTIKTFQNLAEDWRFGRISMGVRGTSVDEAITYYSRRKSPTLMIIQTETTDEDFQKKLEDLANVCSEGTAAIVIGPVNDVQLYRHLTGMGISDYLVRPVNAEHLVEAIATSLQDLVGAVDSHLMAITGVKGGVGTTAVSSMLASIMAYHLNAKVLVLDASGGASTLWNQFGFSPSGTLIEAARAIVDKDEDAFSRLIIKLSDNLHILNCGAESILDNPVATQAYEMLLDKCLSVYPHIVLDLSGAPVQIKRMVLARANSIGIVATPRVPDLSLAKLLLKDLNDMPGSHSRIPTIFLNKTGLNKNVDVPAKDVEEALEAKSLVEIPWHATLFAEAENSGEMLAALSGFKSYIPSLSDVIIRMTGLKTSGNVTTETKGGLGSILGILKGKG